ncbi:MAG TPA: IPT/TIG domain-containing protein [Chthonomonadaceae bacterium]|nr:IPT/TIG domain-containing protein [Chthonomonadaceae bacterium]
MQSLLRTALGVASLLLVTSPLLAQTSPQGQSSDIIVPPSSIENPEDAGVRAHTHLLIFNTRGGLTPAGGLGPGGGMTPAQMRSFYNLPSSGGGQIIAIVDAYDFPTALSDFNTFANNFGLPKETSSSVTSSSNKVFQIVYASGSKPADGSSSGWTLEEALDIEWAHAMAPGAKIVLVECNSASYADLFTGVSVASGYTDGETPALSTREVSMSWGSGEFSGETSYDSYFTSSNVVYFASAGDNGAPAGYPSSSPNLISAGGTTVNTNSSGAFTSETGWSGSGGGPSSQEGRPSYQNAISGIVGSSRGTPDLSYDADPNTGASVYITYYGGWGVVGGTSWSSPALAGCLNLADSNAGAWASGSQAVLASLYSNLGSANFRDITSGNNGYAAGPGWDFVTGVGSLQGVTALTTTLVPAISSLSPNSATAGGAAFTLTVNGSNFVSSAKVNWNGTALTTTFVSSAKLTASVPAADIASAGTASVTVSQNNQTSSAATFTINSTATAPTLSKISPTSTLAGGPAFTLTATGTNFISTSVVQWNGTALTTTFVSSTQLKATVPSTDIASAGTAHVTVYTSGGGTSLAKSISIKETSLALSVSSLVKNADGSFTAKINLKNTGYLSANSLSITASSLGAAGTSTSLPVSLGNVAAGSTGSVTLNYPSSAGSSGSLVTLKVVSKFTGGSSSNTLRVTLP